MYKTEYRIKQSKNHFCCRDCHTEWQKTNPLKGKANPFWHGGKMTVPCCQCGKEMRRYRSDISDHKNVFCNLKCFHLWQRENTGGANSHSWKGGKVIVQCHICGNDIEREPNQLRRNKNNFYGRDCWRKWRSSDEWRRENNPTWKSHLTDADRIVRHYSEPLLRKWIREVKRRDDFTCWVCGYQNENGEMVAHHLNAWSKFPEQRIDLNNGVVMCEQCHNEFHFVYGKGNNTIEQFIEFWIAKPV